MKNFSKDLLNWYNVNKRTFPWREQINIYHTWICEVMSQQTILSVVLPRFEEFINELPDLNSLANCSDDKLRKLWVGLGYYARARNLRKGAQYILEEFHGNFPKNKTEWLRVPGCGPYTASVIASICFNEPVACVDGNVVRVVSRLLNFQAGVWEKEGQNKISSYVNDWISKENPGDFNQAMMDLGATICKKQNPSCHLCPVKSYCQAYSLNTVNLCPPIKPRKISQAEMLCTLIFMNASTQSVALFHRNNGFLNNTTGFPIIRASVEEFFPNFTLELKKIGLTAKILNGEFKHSITHHKIFGKAILIKNLNNDAKLKKIAQEFYLSEEYQWISFAHLKHNLSSSLDLKVLKILSSL